jgi:quercetin dioxygenase-like cupin family protein
MAARVIRAEESAGPTSPGEVEAAMRAEGLAPRRWGNGPGDRYGWHEHGYHKVLYCLSGSIVFHTRTDGDLELHPGDRLEIEPGTAHAATVGSQGVECVEAPR